MAVENAIQRLAYLLQDVEGDLEYHPNDEYDRGYRNGIAQALNIIKAEV